MIVMPTWEIVSLVILGIMLLIFFIRVGLIGVVFDILGAILGGSSGSGSSGGSGFGGGSSGGGGSSSDWD